MAIESSIVFFPVKDIKSTHDFYVNKIGLKLHQIQKSEASECRIYDSGYGFIGFCQYNDGRTIYGGLCISFNCHDDKDVDQQFNRVKDLGVEVVQPPQHHTLFPVYSCFFKDPDNYTVEFQYIHEHSQP